MATKLDKELKREIDINGTTHTLLIHPDGLKITPKRGRIPCCELTWPTLLQKADSK